MITPRILVVDDTPEILKTLSTYLGYHQLTVDTASDYETARGLLDRHAYSVVLLDIVLPVESGVLLLDHIKSTHRTTEVIMITGNASAESIIESFRKRADDVLMKPIIPEDLVLKLAQIHKRQEIAAERDRERMLRKNYQFQLETVFHTLNEGILTVDLQGRVSFVNQALKRICGIKNGHPGLRTLDEFADHCSASCIRHFKRAITERIPLKEYQFDCLCDKNRRKVLVLNSIELANQDMHFGFTMVIRDISDVFVLEKSARQRRRYGNIIGQSREMQRVYDILDNLVDQDPDVLITGESGTGKELIAQQLHEISPRKNNPFVKVDCASAAESLFSSDLFGHIRGAYTGASRDRKGRFLSADKGTIFLDEIGELPQDLQKKLLRVLQDRELEQVGGDRTIKVDVRVIAATNQDLRQLISEKRFREDLYQRLRVMEIDLPPLRERIDDLPLLFDYFRQQLNDLREKNIQSLAPEVLNWFAKYDWPGNVRELRNALECASLLCRGEIIKGVHLPRSFGFPQPASDGEDSPPVEFTREILVQTMLEVKFNKSRAAAKLGISRPTLYKKLKEYNI